jgi:hypothetical protein
VEGKSVSCYWQAVESFRPDAGCSFQGYWLRKTANYVKQNWLGHAIDPLAHADSIDEMMSKEFYVEPQALRCEVDFSGLVDQIIEDEEIGIERLASNIDYSMDTDNFTIEEVMHSRKCTERHARRILAKIRLVNSCQRSLWPNNSRKGH